jgi:hypothetical protein
MAEEFVELLGEQRATAAAPARVADGGVEAAAAAAELPASKPAPSGA